jgi:hypothetical protein
MHARSLDHSNSGCCGDCFCLFASYHPSGTDEPVRRGYLVTSHAQLSMPAAVFVRCRLAWVVRGIEKHLLVFGVLVLFCDVWGLVCLVLRRERIALVVRLAAG